MDARRIVIAAASKAARPLHHAFIVILDDHDVFRSFRAVVEQALGTATLAHRPSRGVGIVAEDLYLAFRRAETADNVEISRRIGDGVQHALLVRPVDAGR